MGIKSIGSKWIWAVVLLSVFSFLIKLPGLDWGFPGTLHNDESNVVRSSLGMRFGDLNPHHFDWPSLYFYINYFVFLAFIKFRVLLQILFTTEAMQNMFPFWWQPDLPFYYLARIITTALLSINIIVVYFLSREYGLSKKFSFGAALIFSVGVLSNFFSFYGIADTALTLLVTITAYYCVRITKYEDLKNYLFAGVFAGLATSIKYNGAIMCILILAAHIFRTKKISIGNILNRNLVLAATVSLVFFFVGTPYALLDWDTFSRTDSEKGAFWQMSHIGRGLNWGYHMFMTTPENFGWLATLIGIYGGYLVIKNRNRTQWFLFGSYLLLLLHIGSWGITRSHYTLPMFPFFSVLIATGFEKLTKRLNPNLFYFLLFLVLLTPVTRTTIELIKRNSEDTRLTSGRWINQNIAQGSSILSPYELTQFYGGSLPVFEYRNYKIYKIKYIESADDIESSVYYLIIAADDEIDKAQYTDDNLIYVLDDRWKTGPAIRIYRIQKN